MNIADKFSPNTSNSTVDIRNFILDAMTELSLIEPWSTLDDIVFILTEHKDMDFYRDLIARGLTVLAQERRIDITIVERDGQHRQLLYRVRT